MTRPGRSSGGPPQSAATARQFLPGGLLVLCALSLLSACSYSIVRGGEINESAAAGIERGIASLRGLQFVTPVPMEVKTAEELRRYLQDEIDRQYSPQEIHGLQRVYERLGLLPKDVDLGEAILKLYTAQIAGFYDPHAGKLFLVPSGMPPTGWMINTLQFLLRRDLANEMLLAHELTHALQDQHFGTLAVAGDPSNDDRSLAIHAILEGDATLAGFAYLLGGLPEGSLLDLLQRLDVIPTELEAMLPDTPAVLRDSLVFQYSAGARFVALAYLHAGWAGVNALLAYPPTSTEQVLWPERFFIRPDSPTDVRLGGLEDYRSSPKWSEVEENTLGALTVRILLEGFFDRDRAEKVALGWDGDRLAAFARGDELHLYWMSTWDSPASAAEFFAAESEILQRKYPTAARQVDAERISAAGDDPYRLERRDDKVLLVLGMPAEDSAKRAGPLWTKSAFSPPGIQLDLDLARAH